MYGSRYVVSYIHSGLALLFDTAIATSNTAVLPPLEVGGSVSLASTEGMLQLGHMSETMSMSRAISSPQLTSAVRIRASDTGLVDLAEAAVAVVPRQAKLAR